MAKTFRSMVYSITISPILKAKCKLIAGLHVIVIDTYKVIAT